MASTVYRRRFDFRARRPRNTSLTPTTYVATVPGGSSWYLESIELHIAESGGRRHSAEDSPTASTDKGWYLESLEAGVSPAGKRRK